MEIFGWDRDAVDVEGSKYASSPKMRDAIQVVIDQDGDTLRIRVIRPKNAASQAGARFLLRVPRKVELERVATTNAAVRVENIDGPVRLRTTNAAVLSERIRGPLEVITSNAGVELRDIRGPAVVRTSNGRVTAEGVHAGIEATTSNGSIAAQIATSEPQRSIKLETTNGSIDLALDGQLHNIVRATTSNAGITVRLPEHAGVRVRAVTSNAPVSTDFEVRETEVSRFNRLEGTIGEGGPTLDLATSNAAIQVMKQ